MAVKAPFSRRTNGTQWIQNDFPSTARTALNHLLHDIVDRGYVGGWIDVDKELCRLSRESPKVYRRDSVPDIDGARKSVERIIQKLSWEKVFDFCERLYSHLSSDVRSWDGYANDWEVQFPREEIQNYISDELQRIFLEENLAYSFTQGEIMRRGTSHTMKQVSSAEQTFGDPRLNDARKHFAKAMNYYKHPKNPDFENTVKEAVCAVEAAARNLFPETKAKTLGEVINRIKGNREGQLSKPLADTIVGLYAYRNAGDGISHGGSDGGKATRYVAEYAISIAASQIIFLYEVAAAAQEDVPF